MVVQLQKKKMHSGRKKHTNNTRMRAERSRLKHDNQSCHRLCHALDKAGWRAKVFQHYGAQTRVHFPLFTWLRFLRILVFEATITFSRRFAFQPLIVSSRGATGKGNEKLRFNELVVSCFLRAKCTMLMKWVKNFSHLGGYPVFCQSI